MKGLKKMINKGILYVVSGPSGAGKGTVCSTFTNKHPECGLSISATTRAPRPGEKDGVNYHFLTREEFRDTITKDGFLEYAVFCDNYYGTPKAPVMEMLKNGQDVILEIEVQGALQVRTHFPEAVFVFVIPPSMEELEARLRGRGTESDEVIKQRLARAKEEFKLVDKYNYIVLNDTVDNAVEQLEGIMLGERCRMERNYEEIKKEFID